MVGRRGSRAESIVSLGLGLGLSCLADAPFASLRSPVQIPPVCALVFLVGLRANQQDAQDSQALKFKVIFRLGTEQ